ncbi:MAG TPA: aminomethyl-transferring glycine dehydrogenase subunit GcvPA [Candidatus Dormibacteraeota bacterium]|nr:aminomethyl-transferring glycine dehydrogenase subunit GcvPA [Candidatus Dormibacteraeota bacterium]
MRYLPKSPSDREAMLKAIGARSADDLFAPIPAEYRLKRDLNVPRQMAESEIVDWFRQRSRENGDDYSSFLGAGAYFHYRPVIIDSLISRGEFLTAYTPYQAEVSQGTLQSIFEFQTMISELTGMDLANASMYDGSTASTEAVLMAVRLTGRSSALVARNVHPEYREVLATYALNQGMPVATLGYGENGRIDLRELEKTITPETACVLIQSPNFFGTIEDVPAIADIAHKNGALLVVAISEAVSLGIVEPPRQADIIAMEAQAFGVPLGFGGPYCGVIATREQYVRQMPGRLVGQTTDKTGKRGFVLTLATREQHIRREKATSNICTNHSLCALAASVYMTYMGEAGLRDVADVSFRRAHSLAERLGKLPGWQPLFPERQFLNEFPMIVPKSRQVMRRLSRKGILGGLEVGRWFRELKDVVTFTCTEVNDPAAIDQLVEALSA